MSRRILLIFALLFIGVINVNAAYSTDQCQAIGTYQGKEECNAEPNCQWSNTNGCMFIDSGLENPDEKAKSDALNCSQYNGNAKSCQNAGCTYNGTSKICEYSSSAPENSSAKKSSDSDYIEREKDTTPIAENFCEDFKSGLKVVGYVILVAKYFIPFLIIFKGSMDVYQSITAGKPEDDLKKRITTLAFRVIAGLIIMFMPTILNTVVSFIGSDSEYETCSTCIFDVNNCN